MREAPSRVIPPTSNSPHLTPSGSGHTQYENMRLPPALRGSPGAHVCATGAIPSMSPTGTHDIGHEKHSHVLSPLGLWTPGPGSSSIVHCTLDIPPASPASMTCSNVMTRVLSKTLNMLALPASPCTTPYAATRALHYYRMHC